MRDPAWQASNRVRFVKIGVDEVGQRIDNYLLCQFKGIPRSHIYKILRAGEVRVNKKRVKPVYKLVAGDEIRLPPVRTGRSKVRRPPDEVIKLVASRIVYDDADLFVVNKPAGLAVHAGSGVAFGVIDAMRQIDMSVQQLFLVHRLDRDTSGCLLIARNRQVLRTLQIALQAREVGKFYTALLMGSWGRQDSKISVSLRRNQVRGGKRLVQADTDGKRAVSDFKVIREYAGKPAGMGCSLMKIQLITGRTHQIRVHGAEKGHPLAGDGKYGDEKFNRQMRSLGLKRMFLHASALEFTHPGSGQTISVEAPLDNELQRILDRLAV